MSQLFLGTRIGFETRGNNDDPATNDATIVRIPVALLWKEVIGLEQVSDPSLCFDSDDVTEDVCQLTTYSGELYVLGVFKDLLKQWQAYLQANSYQLLN